MSDPTAAAVKLALQALRHREWGYGNCGWSAQCLWCGGYERTPAMDQDYYGEAGHKPDCIRQAAIAALEVLI